jgi:hypothetical protein
MFPDGHLTTFPNFKPNIDPCFVEIRLQSKGCFMRAAVDQLTVKFLTITAFSSVSLFAVSPAFAQGVHVEVSEQTTNGRVFGWEHNLTERDPNLSHWHWEPMDASSHQRSVRRYVDRYAADSKEPREIVRSHYVKPIHVALPMVARAPATIDSTRESTTDTSIKLLRRKQGPAAMTKTMAVATDSDYAGGGASRSTLSQAVTTQVAGNIVHVSGRRSSCNEAPATY